MRITAEEKAATRKRILAAARTLFRSKGFDQSTTRDIASEVGVATGTMFNYFRSKEAIVVELASIALEKARGEIEKQEPHADLAESLFAVVAAQLRALRPLRGYIRPFMDAVLAPGVSASNVAPEAEVESELRQVLHEQLLSVMKSHGYDDPTPMQLNILWSLYVGAISFWSADKSPRQEDSLALLDQSTRMFADWLGA